MNCCECISMHTLLHRAFPEINYFVPGLLCSPGKVEFCSCASSVMKYKGRQKEKACFQSWVLVVKGSGDVQHHWLFQSAWKESPRGLVVVSQRACGPYDAYDADLLKWELRWCGGLFTVYTIVACYHLHIKPRQAAVGLLVVCVEAKRWGEQITPKSTQQWLTDQGIHVFDCEGTLYLHTVDD